MTFEDGLALGWTAAWLLGMWISRMEAKVAFARGLTRGRIQGITEGLLEAAERMEGSR